MKCTEFEAKVEALLIVEVRESYRLWCLSTEMVRNIRFLDLVQVLGSRTNVHELDWSLRVIKHTNFASLPDYWARRDEGRSLVPGRRGRGGDYLF